MTTQELKMLRLQTEMNALTAAEHDLDDVDGRISVLEQQMEDLALSLAAAREWRTDIISRRNSLREHLAATRRAVSPFGACPEDILRSIFEQVTHQPDLSWTRLGTGFFNPARAAAPFLVAAVCQLWRGVALHAPNLWGYIGIPRLETSLAQDGAFVARTQTMIERSCAAPLDILIQDMHDEKCEAYAEILDLLYPHLYRWRRFELWSSTSFSPLVSYLRGSAPRLEEFYVCTQRATSWDSDPAPYLAGSTCLRVLHLHHSSLVIDTTNLSKLETLVLQTSMGMPSAAFWTLFGCTSELKYLSVDAKNWSTIDNAIPDIVVLPKLNNLQLMDHATSIIVHHPTVLSVPLLTELGLHCVPSEDAVCLTRVLDCLTSGTAFARIRTLSLSKTALKSADAQHVGNLGKVSCLDVKDCPSVEPGFWTALRTAPSSLRLLRLANAKMTADSIAALLTMVRSRCSSQPRGTTFEASIDSSCNLTNRDRAELKAMM